MLHYSFLLFWRRPNARNVSYSLAAKQKWRFMYILHTKNVTLMAMRHFPNTCRSNWFQINKGECFKSNRQIRFQVSRVNIVRKLSEGKTNLLRVSGSQLYIKRMIICTDWARLGRRRGRVVSGAGFEIWRFLVQILHPATSWICSR